MELLIATRNQGKVREIRELLKDLNFKISSLEDYPDLPHIVEDGKTFAANALKKAATISQYTKTLVMGEDSGLEVKALGNRPGIHSARYSGENATDRRNNSKLLRDLRNVKAKDRRARYRCFVALTDAKGIIAVVSGSCSGMIAAGLRGRNGFGYDPLFLLPKYNKTFGELDPSIKSRVSHRARAMRKVKKILTGYLKSN